MPTETVVETYSFFGPEDYDQLILFAKLRKEQQKNVTIAELSIKNIVKGSKKLNWGNDHFSILDVDYKEVN